MSKRKRRTGNSQPTNISIVKEKLKDNEVKRSMQLSKFDKYYASNEFITPPYEPKSLLNIIEESSYLKQHIEVMATNIAKFGHAIRYKADFDFGKEEDEEIKKEAERELDKLTRLYKYINPTESFKKILEKMLIDRESIGWGCIEVMRDGKGEVSFIEHIRAANIRIVQLSEVERKPQSYEIWEKNDDGNYDIQIYYKRFKKFVQVINEKKVYFKEFGDKRFLNARTGRYTETHNGDLEANELAFFAIYNPTTSYGIPRWTGAIVDIVGNRASEELNLTYFESGTILPAAITVDGGQLTEGSIEAIKEGKGLGNAYKMLLLETAPFEDEDDYGTDDGKKPNVKTQIHKLSDNLNKDGLFQEYQSRAKEKIRSSFRLPPIFLGDSSDYTRSTAEVAKQIAEEQIFESAREDICSVFNNIINNDLAFKYVEVYLKGPDNGSIIEKAAALDVFVKAGSVSPNMLLEALGELLNKNFQPFPEEYGNIPIEVLKINQNTNVMNTNIDRLNEIEELVKIREEVKKFIGDEYE